MANEIKIVDDLRGVHPALVNEIEKAAVQQARSGECQRVQDTEEMTLPGSKEQTFEAKYTKPIGANTYTKAAMKKAKGQGNTWLNGARNDAEHLDGVKKETPGDGKQDEFMSAIKSMGGKK